MDVRLSELIPVGYISLISNLFSKKYFINLSKLCSERHFFRLDYIKILFYLRLFMAEFYLEYFFLTQYESFKISVKILLLLEFYKTTGDFIFIEFYFGSLLYFEVA